MREVKSPSFEVLEPDQIEECHVLEHITSATRSGSTHKTGSETWACVWAPDGSYFAWSSGHRMLHLMPWDGSKQKCHDTSDLEGLRGRKYHLIDCSETVWSLAFGSGISQREALARKYRRCRFDENLIIATGLQSGRIKLWNCQTGALIIELLDHRDTVRCLDFTKDGSLQLLSASRDGTLKFWDLENDGNMYRTLKSHAKMFYGCKFSPNKLWIAAVGSARLVFLYKLKDLSSSPYRLEGHCNDVVSCDFSPDSALLATAAYDTKVILWDTFSRQKVRILGHMYPSPRLIFAGGANNHYVRSCSFSREGTTLSTICDDGYVRFWKLDHEGDPLSISCVNDAVSSHYSPDGGTLAVGCRNGDVFIFAAPTRVAKLTQLSRVAIRKQMTTDEFDSLPIPRKLIQFLRYRDFYQDDSRI